jgi:hypothetical protein
MENLKTEVVSLLAAVKNQLTIHNLVIYLIEGLAVAIAAYVIPNRRTKINEIVVIALIASASFFVLDLFSEKVGSGSRLGTGIGIGYNLVNMTSALPFV